MIAYSLLRSLTVKKPPHDVNIHDMLPPHIDFVANWVCSYTHYQGAHFISGIEAVEVGAVNEAVPEADLHAAVLEYTTLAAKQGVYQQKLVKLAINNAQDNQGYTSHIKSWLGQWVAMMIGRPPRDPNSRSMIPKEAAAEARAMRPKL